MNRDFYSAIKDILEALPDNQTRIQYKANLSFYQVRKFFKLLLDTGLMKTDGNYYWITGKGEHALYYADNLALIVNNLKIKTY
jgi:predicted transcriptional regulator